METYIHGDQAPGPAAPDRRQYGHPESETRPGKDALLEGKDHENEQSNSATAVATCKADITRVATAALSGVELVRLADGAWLAQRWGWFRTLASDADLHSFLAKIRGHK